MLLFDITTAPRPASERDAVMRRLRALAVTPGVTPQARTRLSVEAALASPDGCSL